MIGVNVHDWPLPDAYGNIGLVIKCLDDYKPAVIRIGPLADGRIIDWCRNNNAKIILSGVTDSPDFNLFDRRLGEWSDIIYALEGRNEPDLEWAEKCQWKWSWSRWRFEKICTVDPDWPKKCLALQLELLKLAEKHNKILLTPAAGRRTNEAICLAMPGQPNVHRYSKISITDNAVVTEAGSKIIMNRDSLIFWLLQRTNSPVCCYELIDSRKEGWGIYDTNGNLRYA